MGKVTSITVTLHRTDDFGTEYETTAYIHGDGWSQSGGSVIEAGESRDLVAALFEAAIEHLNVDEDEMEDA